MDAELHKIGCGSQTVEGVAKIISSLDSTHRLFHRHPYCGSGASECKVAENGVWPVNGMGCGKSN